MRVWGFGLGCICTGMNRDLEPSRMLAKSRHSPGGIADQIAQQLGQNALHGIGHIMSLWVLFNPRGRECFDILQRSDHDADLSTVSFACIG